MSYMYFISQLKNRLSITFKQNYIYLFLAMMYILPG